MIELYRFQENDIDLLISWIPDERFLLQWAGHLYSWPLTRTQIERSLELSSGDKPTSLIFKAVDTITKDVVGHAELLRIDYEKKTSHIGRVLIGNPLFRNKGLGHLLMNRLIKIACDEMGLKTLTLNVFEFNVSAIRCYQSLGFIQYDFQENSCQISNESWNVIRMRLCNP